MAKIELEEIDIKDVLNWIASTRRNKEELRMIRDTAIQELDNFLF